MLRIKMPAGPLGFWLERLDQKEVRSCTIPFGKSLLLSPIEVLCTPVDTPGVKTEEDMRKCAKEDQDKVNLVKVTVDGVDIPAMTDYRFQSPLFNLTLPENNALGVPAQETQGVSDGYFVMLKPLSQGEHENKISWITDRSNSPRNTKFCFRCDLSP